MTLGTGKVCDEVYGYMRPRARSYGVAGAEEGVNPLGDLLVECKWNLSAIRRTFVGVVDHEFDCGLFLS